MRNVIIIIVSDEWRTKQEMSHIFKANILFVNTLFNCISDFGSGC